MGGSVLPKNLKKCMKLNWNFQRGGRWVLEKIPSVVEVWIFWNYILVWSSVRFLVITDEQINMAPWLSIAKK